MAITMDNGSDKNFTSFLDWSVSEVIEWLQSLGLHANYERQFQEGHVDGKLLLKFNQSLLDQLQVTDNDDRVAILQTITAMRADLMTNSNDSNAIIKIPRPNSANSSRSRHLSASNMQSSESSRNSTPSGDHTIPSHGRHRHCSLTTELKVWEHRRLLSKSLDRLTESDESSQKSSAPSSKQFSSTSSSRLVDILREENATLKKDLDSYYQRVRKLHKIEQEVERIREAHTLLEESTKRREKLENAMRTKMEQQLKKLKEANVQLEVELQVSRSNGTSQVTSNEASNDKTKLEIARRDSMIKRLIKQNKDSASEREKLQKDLLNTKSALEDIKKEETSSTVSSQDSVSSPRISSSDEQQSHLAEMYSKSLDNLRAILSEMTAMSENKEKIENKLRLQLMQELAALKQKQHTNGVPQVDSNVVASSNAKVASLEVKVARLEHKCLELVAEKQMELDAATVPRDTMIAQMKRTIAEQKDTIEELRQQKMKYMVQLYDANKKMADLENKKAILQLNVAEKDSLIQTLQQSYAEVDDDLWAANGEEMSPTLKTLSSSPTVVQSPDSPKHSSYHELHGSNGTLVGDINEGGTKLMSSGSTSYSPTGKMKFSGLNLAVATSINDFSPSGQSKHYSSSVPSSPNVTHRLLHTSGHPSKKDNFTNFTKSQSAELAWMFSSSPRELGDHKLSKSSSGSITHGNKNYSRSRKILKSFSTGRNSPLADYSQDSGFGVFSSANGTPCDAGFGSREESRHTPWQV